MPLKEVKTDKAPQAIGPYSQGIEAGNLIYCSGQIGIDPQSGLLVSSEIVGQTKQALENVKQILLGGGASLDCVVRAEVYLKNMSDYQAMNEIYEKAFSSNPKPSRVTVEVARLPKDALIEIACTAWEERT